MPNPGNIFKNRHKKQTKTYTYGKVAGIEVGTILASRQECSDRGLHGPTQAGIHGNTTYGAYSVVLSGGYEDDVDDGDKVWYTGEGGRKNGGGPQIADQDWKNKNNRSLKISCASQRYPIRVIRGHTLHSRYAPKHGYRYDGLYRVAKAIQVRGKVGKLLCRFLFLRQGGQPPLPQPNPSSLPPPKPQKNKQKLSHTDCEDESEAMDAQSSATSSRTKLLSSKSSYKVQDNELEAMEIEDSQETDSVKGTSSSSVRSGFIFKKNGQGSKDHKKNRSEVKQEHQQDSEESNEEPTAALADESLSFLTSGKRKRIYITSSDEESSLIPRRRNRENSRITTLISPIPATEEDRKTPKQILIPRKKNHTSRWNGGSRKSFPLKSVASIHREKLGMSDTQEGILPESHISHSVIALSVAPHVQSFPNESFPTANAPSAMLLSPASSEVVGNAASLPPASGTNGSPTTCPPSSQLASSHMKPIRSASPPSAASGSPPDLPAPSASQSSVVSSETIMPSPNPASSTRLHSYKKPALSLLSVPPFSASTSVIVSPTSSLPPPQTVVASTVPSTSPLPVPSPTLQRDPQSQMQSRFDWSNLLNDLYRLRMEEMRMLQGHHKA